MKPVLLLPLLVVPLVACGDADSKPPAARSGSGDARSASVGGLFDGAPDRTSDEPSVAVERGFGLSRLPASTLLAVRVTSLGRHGDAWERLALTRAMDELDGLGGLLEQPLAMLRSEVAAGTPGGDTLLQALDAVEGEAVLAVTDVWPELAMAMNGAMPFAVAAFVELGDGEADVRAFLDATVDDPPRDATFERVGDDGYRADHRAVRAELRFTDGRLCAWVGPLARSSGAIDRLLEQDPATSFAGSPLVRSAPGAADGETRWMEAFLSFAAVWPIITKAAPPDARPVLDALGLRSIEGLSFVSSLDGDSFHDVATLHTDGDDVLSALLDQDAIDPDWTRYVFAGAESGGVTSFSPEETLERFRRCLPAEGRRGLADGLAMFEQMSGVDLMDDVLGRLGPHFVHGSRGDLASAMLDGENFEAFVAIEVREADALQELLDRAFQSGMLPIVPRPRRVTDVEFHSIALPIPQAPPGLEPSYGFVGNALVIASSGDVFGRVVAAHQSGKATPAWLRDALAAAGDGAFVVSAGETAAKVRGLHATVRTAQAESGEEWPYLPTVEQVDAFTAGLPAEWNVGRRAEHGFVFEGRSPFGAALAAAAPVAIVAAVALPSLLTARLSANEEAAIAQLRSLHSAQERFRSSGAADRDGDGRGEYGTFGELTGSAALPDGSRLSPPVLGGAFAQVRDGAVERSGYVLRLALPGRDGAPLGERADGGAPDGVDTRMAEQVWLAYAYPRRPGATGNRVFFIDQTGHVLFTTNDAPSQAYGPGNPPSFDAAFAADDRPMAQGGHVGRDGGFWMLAY